MCSLRSKPAIIHTESLCVYNSEIKVKVLLCCCRCLNSVIKYSKAVNTEVQLAPVFIV